jgi:hypothetical protein
MRDEGKRTKQTKHPQKNTKHFISLLPHGIQNPFVSTNEIVFNGSNKVSKNPQVLANPC